MAAPRWLDKRLTRCHHTLVKLRYRFRYYPTEVQASMLTRVFGTTRFVYNWALRARTDAYAEGNSINYNTTSSMLTKLKRTEGYEWIREVSCVPPQQALRHLQTAFHNFFEKRARYPTFKKKRGKQSAEYTTSAFKWDATHLNLSISGLGRLKIVWSRQFTSVPTTATITKDTAGRYFVTLVLDETVEPMPKTGKSVGVDLGINRLATLSNGERIHNPRHTKRLEKRLARAQRTLSRRVKGSHRREFQRLKVARIQAKIADCRQDNLHKVTTDLVKRFDRIVIEDLDVRGMLHNYNLAKHLSDASFGAFRRTLEYKCAWYGKDLLFCDRFFPSSKRCSTCGHVVETLPLNIRVWTCPECGECHDRDENAAKNILGAGRVPTAHGETVRRSRSKDRKRLFRQSVNQPVERSLHRSSGIPLL